MATSSPTLESILANIGAYQQGSEEATKQITSKLDANANLANQSAQQFKTNAEDEATVSTAKTTSDLVVQSNRLKVANAFHTNIQNTTEEYTKYAALADQAQRAKDEALANIAAKDSISIFDNPIEYLFNKFTINSDIAQHNAADAMLESANSRIQSMNINTQQSVATQNALAQPVTEASAAASARIAANVSLLNASEQEQKANSYNIKSIENALNTTKENLSFQFQANNAANAEKQIQISLSHLAMAREEFAFKKQEYAEKQNDKEEQRSLGNSFLATINLGRSKAGEPPIDDISGKMVLNALKGNGQLSQDMQRYYNIGRDTAKAGGTPIFGPTPAIAVANLQGLNIKLNDAQDSVKQLLTDSQAIVGRALQAAPGSPDYIAGINPKDEASVTGAYNKIVQANYNRATQEIKSGDKSNPQQILSINQLAQISPVIQQLPVYQKVLAPLIKQGVDLTDPNKVFVAVGEAASKGIISHSEALELTTIYHVGVATNLASMNFPGFGIIPKRTYNARIEDSPGMFNTTDVIDLTKPDSVSSALIKRQAQILRQQLMNLGSSGTNYPKAINIQTTGKE